MNSLCQVWLWVRMHEAISQSRDLVFTAWRNVKCVKYILYEAALHGPAGGGMHISIDWKRLKSCQAVCDACMRGKTYSSLSWDAGCLAMWSWWESCVIKILGGIDQGFVLFLFATMGCHIARLGIFWTPTLVLWGVPTVSFLPYSEISSKSVNTFFINIANRHKLSGSRWWSRTVPTCVTFIQGMAYFHHICCLYHLQSNLTI